MANLITFLSAFTLSAIVITAMSVLILIVNDKLNKLK